MKHILFVFGTRPETIKLAPVIKTMRQQPDRFRVGICLSGQHRKMLKQTLRVFDIAADINLDIMTSDQDLFTITRQNLKGLQRVLAAENPDLVMVQGDTSTALAGGLAAYYQKIPLAHVEAGLRTGDKFSPYPEEMNRRLLGALSDYHFAPTARAKANLMAENVSKKSIWITGNTVVDALLGIMATLRAPRRQEKWRRYFRQRYRLPLPALDDKTGAPIILVTGHRRENFGQPLENICRALRELAVRRPDCRIVYPVHLNPRVRVPVRSILAGQPNIHLLEPLNYEAFVFLLASSYFILTDSGGIQEEAPTLGKPVLVMRQNSERPEAIEAGTALLAGTGYQSILVHALELLENPRQYKRMSRIANPFGDGRAGSRIAAVISHTEN